MSPSTRGGARRRQLWLFWIVTAAVVAIAIPLSELAISAAHRDDPYPHASQSPADVVRIQLDALSRNALLEDDGGIEIAYRFASPSNRAATGPIERFRRIVHAPAYRVALDHERAELGEVAVEGRFAIQLVTIVGRDGREAHFVFELSRQTRGRLSGCWLTDAVVPVRVDEHEAPQLEI